MRKDLAVLPGTVDQDIRRVLMWLDDYVSAPHPDLGRSGDVCPFVRVARMRRHATLALRYDVEGGSGDEVAEAVREEMGEFSQQVPAQTTTRIVVFPAIPDQCWEVVDEVYSELKDEAVGQGLMIGQFHPRCREPAVRNPAFPVSRSPLPLFALRWMAVHDILFLGDRKHWFDRYRARFGTQHQNGRVSDPLLRERYAEALRRYDYR
ncbi:hypothetical protein Lesp02_00620 [Lentzea sp. NBRC 105346]|uniref:DUF6875 domain-containing protein n=1 Tax=Lentzea sp. NBRC 105346 TaxID=3032205 RepID=UPI0024A59855|nr:hypothetical protein [Lentzea sp. NBRC 105346]GLZ27872.1 hypothetical protein Lesp02_00620 [Lentzea sp. NBRC 105346]